DVAGFVAKIGPYSGTGKVALVYSTVLNSSSISLFGKVAADATGAAYVTGNAYSGFPFVNGFHPFGSGDAFVTRINPYSGTGPVTIGYSTSLGSGNGTSVAVDSTGAAYVTGTTGSNLVTANPFQGTFAGGTAGIAPDGFVAKISPFTGAPVTLVYST